MYSQLDEETERGLEELARNLGMDTNTYSYSDSNGKTVYLSGGLDEYSRTRLKELLRNMNMLTSGPKHLPAWLPFENLSIRRAVFSGLVESDGCLATRDRVITFDQTVESIVQGFYPLIRSLGLPCHVSIREGGTSSDDGWNRQDLYKFKRFGMGTTEIAEIVDCPKSTVGNCFDGRVSNAVVIRYMKEVIADELPEASLRAIRDAATDPPETHPVVDIQLIGPEHKFVLANHLLVHD